MVRSCPLEPQRENIASDRNKNEVLDKEKREIGHDFYGVVSAVLRPFYLG